MLSADKLDGFIFGRLVKSTLATSNGALSRLEVSELVKSTGLTHQRVHAGCRRLAERGFIELNRSEVQLTELGKSAVRARFRE
ncbi:MAG: helix-turn-helix domain-containing protein [Myxococcota bacterium]